MNTSIFKAYDIRGIYPTDINEETVIVIGKAIAHMFPAGEVIIAYDARHGSSELAEVLEISVATEAKKMGKEMTITPIGLSTTPLFYFTVCDRKAVGGCMMTASHNPKEYNGIKVVSAMGKVVSGTEVLEAVNALGK